MLCVYCNKLHAVHGVSLPNLYISAVLACYTEIHKILKHLRTEVRYFMLHKKLKSVEPHVF